MTTRVSVGLISLVTALVAAACGSAQAPAQPQPTPTTPPPAPSASAPAPAASAAAPEVFDTDLVPTRITPAPSPMPKVALDTPGPDQFLPPTFLKDYKVRPNIGRAEGLPKGAYLQLFLDNRPYDKPITDLKSTIKLTELAPDGSLSEGDHIIAAILCNPNHESIKGQGGVDAHRFTVAKKTPAIDWKSSAPMMILARPHGTYAGAAADDILIDFYVLNALLGQKDNYVHVTLKGPGIKDEKTQNIYEWQPYSIVSPHDGEYTIRAELMDKNGNPVPGPWNDTTRTFKVAK